MATIRVDVIGDSTSLKRALAEAGGAANTAGGHFTSLAKTMVGLGAAFVGASSILEGFKKSVDAAEALNAATRQLDAQLRANGESVKAVAPYVAALNAQFEKLGFTSAETEAAFTRLDRASGSAAIAYKEIGLAADLARAKNISFSQAALLIGKVIDGNTSALNRYGIAIPKGTSAINALAIAHQKLAGQAQAAATPMKVFSATVTDVAAKIGNELLPVIDKYLTQLNKWLSSAQNQEKITNAVAKAVTLFEQAIAAAAEVIKTLAGPTEAVVHALGGFKQAMEDLIALKVAFTLTSWASSFTNVGNQAAGAKGKVSGLGGMLKSLPTAVAITIGLDIIENAHTTKSGLHRYSGSAGWGNLGNDLAGIVGLDWQGKGPSTITSGGAALTSLTSGSAMKQFIAKQAAALGLDPKAVLGVATAEGGFSGAIGDGGHAFGPFQLNNAGGVLTGYQGNPQQYANSAAGIMYALQQMAKVAGGLKGMAAISAIVSRFERPKDPTHDLETAGGYYFGSGSGPSMADIQNGPPGSTTLPNMAGPGGTKKPKAPPAYKLPQALEASIRTAQDTFKNDVSASHLATLKGLLTQEESLLKAHGQDAKAASVANEITDAMKKLSASFLKVAADDAKAAAKAGASAIAAFAKGQDGPAAKYIKAEVADLKAEKAQLEKALAAAPQAEKAAIQTQIEAVSKQIAGLKGVTGWIKSVAEIVGKFSARLKAEGDQYTALLTQQTAASELQAVGYFADTADTLLGINKSIVSSLQEQKATLETEEKDLKAKLASAPASLRAGLKTQIAAIAGKITGLTGSISSAMGTVEQDLASAVTAAQSQFQTAVGNLQTDLDNQLQQNALNASGATADQTQLSAMQAADQLKGLTDSVAAAQKALDADTAAGATSTADQIAQDQAALAAAKRSLDEYNLQIKVQDESATATAAATKQTNDMNTALAGLESDLLSGKITAQQFDTALAGLEKTYGVSVATTSAEFIAVASAARGVEGAFNALISWINSQTGSSIPSVGGAAPSAVNPFPPGANTTTTGGPGGGGFNVPVGASGFSSVPTSPPPGASGYTGNIHTPGLQMALGGIVPGPIGMPVFATIHGGELVIPPGGLGGHSQRSVVAAATGGGVTNHFHIAGSVISERELFNIVRRENQRTGSRNR